MPTSPPLSFHPSDRADARSTVPYLYLHVERERDRPEQPTEQTPEQARGAVPPDIERLLIWTYRDQQAHREGYGIGQERQWLAGGSSDWTRERVDGGGFRTFSLADEAETVHAAVAALGPTSRALVIRHAKTATRPDWRPGARERLGPITDGGRIVVTTEYDKNRNRLVQWCPLRVIDAADVVAELRQCWLVWWSALDHLAAALAVPMIPDRREPWRIDSR